ncbi:MAG TPA: hypothetical protein VG406_08785 [Isosphaeraceae bacterium]|jgi:hypothetical protein|nr:hypothetical protein [Isosphaeraceae bacterium]
MRRRYLLVFLMVLAVAGRAGAVLALRSHRVPRSTYEHGEIAANLLAGRGFAVTFLGAEGPTSQQAPSYPVLVAAAYAMGGVGTPRALLILELGQAALGALLVLGAWKLARAVAPDRPRAAPIAALVVAVHPTLVYSATHVQVATLATTLLVWTLASAYGLRRDRGAIGTGLLLAALALTDPILALVAPGVAWAVVSRRGWRGALRPLGLIALTATLAVAPWIARNYRVHGELVLIKSTFGYAFWQGNCSLSMGTDKVVRRSVERALRDTKPGLSGWNAALWEARHEAGYIDDIALSREDYRTLGRLAEPARSRLLFHRALAELRSDPWRYPTLCLRRLRYFVLFDETNPKARSLVYRAGHLTLTALALLGWLLAGREARRRLMPTMLTFVVIVLFHTCTIVSARFHLPIEPLLGLWAAVGLSGLFPALGRFSLACRGGFPVGQGSPCRFGSGSSKRQGEPCPTGPRAVPPGSALAAAADDVEGVGVRHGLRRGTHLRAARGALAE